MVSHLFTLFANKLETIFVGDGETHGDTAMRTLLLVGIAAIAAWSADPAMANHSNSTQTQTRVERRVIVVQGDMPTDAEVYRGADDRVLTEADYRGRWQGEWDGAWEANGRRYRGTYEGVYDVGAGQAAYGGAQVAGNGYRHAGYAAPVAPPMPTRVNHAGYGGYQADLPPPPAPRLRSRYSENAGYRGDNGYRGNDCRPGNGTAGAAGAAVGAVVGGVAGNRIAGRHERLAGTMIGAGVGALAGIAVDRAASRNNCGSNARGNGYAEGYADDRGYAGYEGRGYEDHGEDRREDHDNYREYAGRGHGGHAVAHGQNGGGYAYSGAGYDYGYGAPTVTTIVVPGQPIIVEETETTYETVTLAAPRARVAPRRPARRAVVARPRPRCTCR